MTLGWPDLIAGFALGAVFGVIFEDPLKRKWKKLLDYLNARLDRWRFGNIRTGELFWAFGRQTSLFIIDGSVDIKYRKDSIRINVGEAPSLPEFISIRRQRELSFRETGEAKWWNGEQIGIKSYSVQRDNAESELHLVLSAYKHDYATFRAITCVLAGDENEEHELNLYSEIIKSVPLGEPAVPLACGLGVFIVVLSKDNRIFSAVRSISSGVRPMQRDFGICEAVHPDLDNIGSGKIDVFNTVLRGVREEVYDGSECNIDVSVIGFVADVKWQQFGFVAYARIDATADQICRERNLGSSGKWELRSVVFERPEEVFRSMRIENTWDLGILSNYMMACHVWGKQKAKKMIGAS